MRKLLIILFLTIIVQSCSNTSPVDLVDGADVIIDSNVLYDKDIKQIIAVNCLNCHNTVPANGATISLDNLSKVKFAITNLDLINRINLNPNQTSLAMPLGGPKLSQLNINLIAQWQINNFAP